MSDAVEIWVEVNGASQRVGLCRYIRKSNSQTSVFEYDAGWLGADGAFAIDPENLPLMSGPFARQSSKSALPGAIRDAAPDRWGQKLIERAFRKSGEARSLSEIDYLLGLNDETRIGALRFRRPGEADFDHDIGRYRVPPLIQLPALLRAADAIHQGSESADDLRLLLNEGSPLGGARPKSAIVDADGSLAIAKFPKPDDARSIPHGEVLALRLAARAGLDVARARIEAVAGSAVSVISRFDRMDQRRIPYISAMTLLGLDDGAEATYTDIAEAIRKHSAAPTEDLHELFRRIVFNVLVSNLDDHLRNHGFQHAGKGQWRLSPAFDLNPVPAFEKARELTTWISDEGPDASLDLARRAAAFFAVKPAQADEIIALQQEVIRGWRADAVRIGMGANDIAAYASAFGD
jgi:serine/threonine-protein kinase HipA